MGAESAAAGVAPIGADVPVGGTCPEAVSPVEGVSFGVVDPGASVEMSPVKLGVLEPKVGSWVGGPLPVGSGMNHSLFLRSSLK